MAIEMLPIENFSQWLDTKLKNREPGELAKQLGICSTRLKEYRTGIVKYKGQERPRTEIKLDVVDSCATKLGTHISEIYPDYIDWVVTDETA